MRILGFAKKANSFLPLMDCMDAFKELGCEVEVIECGEKDIICGEELLDLKRRIFCFSPDFVFTINHAYLPLELLHRFRIPYASYFVDNPLYRDRDVLMRSLNGDCVIFVWDKAYVEAMRALGFKNVFYLRLGVNPKVFRKMELEEDDIGKYGADIGFVGISAYSTLYGFSGYKKYLELIQHPKVEPILNETIERICQDPSIDPKRVLVEVSLSKKVGIRCDKESLFYMTLDYAATSIIRRRVVEAICDFGCSVWGDKGWVEMLSDKIRYCGWADRNTILPKIYNATKINLNVTMAQLRTALPWRVFEVTACGGFLLTDIREDIWSSFDVGKEVIGYRDLRELKEKVEYYLRHQDEREEIARHGMMRTLKDHTYMRRMEEVLEVMSSLYG